jgi:hypothetical protein
VGWSFGRRQPCYWKQKIALFGRHRCLRRKKGGDSAWEFQSPRIPLAAQCLLKRPVVQSRHEREQSWDQCGCERDDDQH